MGTLLNLPGIYKATCLISRRVYVGKSEVSVSGRVKRHKRLLRHGQHPNRHLQAAWNKYGEEQFVFEAIVYCTPEQCRVLEAKYIEHYANAGKVYNKGSSCGGRLSEETKQKIAASLRGRKMPGHVKEAIRQANTGRVTSEETKAKLSAALQGHQVSDQTA